jgi:hypothetical protein
MHRFQRHLAAAFAATLLGACGGGHAPTADELSSSAHDAADAVADELGQAAADREQPAARKGNTPPAVALVADAGVRSVTLNWSDNGASRYDVYLSSSRTCDVRNYTLCPDGRMLPNVRPPYKVDTLDNGRVYYAQVEGFYSKGASRSNLAGARPTTLEFDNNVTAISNAADGTTYVGGDFRRIGLTSGQGLALDALSGRPAAPGYAVITGRVTAAAPDGSGGWYIGGEIQRIGTTDKWGLAHVRADGSLDPNWNPQPNGAVNAIAVMNGVVYIGGIFGTVNGQLRPSLAAIDAASGALTAWNPGPDRGIWTIAAANGTIYVGGTFSAIGGFPRNHVAAIDAFANVLPWDPNADGTVAKLAVSGSTVYVGGFFKTISGQPRAMLAAIGATSGKATAWNPSSTPCTACEVKAIAVSGNTVYVGGGFTQIGSAARSGLAAIDATTGSVLPWNPAPDSLVESIDVTRDTRGTTVYVGGHFGSVGGQPRAHLAALDAQGSALPSWLPQPNGSVAVVAAAGSAIYAGGRFTGLNAVERKHIAAIDAAGSLKAWNPGADGAVLALATRGDAVYAGGTFTSIGGQPRARLAKIDPAGTVSGWNPGADRPVLALQASSSRLYVGGQFQSIGGQSRGYLAAFGLADELLTWHASADNTVHALALGAPNAIGETLYLGGRFGFIGYYPRTRIAQVDYNGIATTWNPWEGRGAEASEVVHALAYGDGMVYAGGSFSSIGANLAQLDAAGVGAVRNYATAVYAVRALALSGRTLYLGGDFIRLNTAGGQLVRNRLAAIDTVARMVTEWSPDVGGTVNAISMSSAGVNVGGSFTTIDGNVEGGFATLAP